MPQIAQALASYWRIAHIERNYNPHRPHAIIETIEDERDNVIEAAEPELYPAADFCAGVLATSPLDKVDRYAGNMPLTTTCDFHAPRRAQEMK